MSHTELIEIVDRSSPEDRLLLQAYLEHLARASDPEDGRDLDRRGVPWKNFRDINFVSINYKPFDASRWPVRTSGLIANP